MYIHGIETILPGILDLMADALANAGSAHARDSIKQIAQTFTERRSINLTNVQIDSPNKTDSNNKKTDPNQKIKMRLEKMDVLRRPKTRKALIGYIKATDRSIKDENTAGKIFEYLRVSGLIREVKNKIEYLDKK